MQVEIKDIFITKKTAWGDVNQQHGHSKVFVNGKHAGYVPANDEKHAGLFHPLSGFPQSLVPEVVKNCKEITSALKAPVPHQKLKADDE